MQISSVSNLISAYTVQGQQTSAAVKPSTDPKPNAPDKVELSSQAKSYLKTGDVDGDGDSK